MLSRVSFRSSGGTFCASRVSSRKVIASACKVSCCFLKDRTICFLMTNFALAVDMVCVDGDWVKDVERDGSERVSLELLQVKREHSVEKGLLFVLC